METKVKEKKLKKRNEVGRESEGEEVLTRPVDITLANTDQLRSLVKP